MATLAIDRTSFAANAFRSRIALHRWLDGSWALLFSNPEHFAPHESTPKGYLTCLASILADNGIKLIELQSQSTEASWIDASDPNRQLLFVTSHNTDVLDLRAHTLIKKIRETSHPFVMVIDQHLQCRTTLNYRPENITRPRTLEDIVETIYVLRGDGPAVEDQEDCEQEPGWRVKTW